jgi:hypothetical protein
MLKFGYAVSARDYHEIMVSEFGKTHQFFILPIYYLMVGGWGSFFG